MRQAAKKASTVIVLILCGMIGATMWIDGLRMHFAVKAAKKLDGAYEMAVARKDWDEARRIMTEQIKIACAGDSFIWPTGICGEVQK